MGWATRSDVERWFTLRKVDPADAPKLDAIREGGRTLALTILYHTPGSADQYAALRHLREAIQAAIASVVCRKRDEGERAAEAPARAVVSWGPSGSYSWICPRCDAPNGGCAVVAGRTGELVCRRCTVSFQAS